jgi:hypothetical protein
VEGRSPIKSRRRSLVGADRIWRQDFKRDGVFIPYGADFPSTVRLEPELEQRRCVTDGRAIRSGE